MLIHNYFCSQEKDPPEEEKREEEESKCEPEKAECVSPRAFWDLRRPFCVIFYASTVT